MVYDAGNRDVDTFVAAMDKTTSGAWGLWGGCVPVDAATAKQLFRRIKERLKRCPPGNDVADCIAPVPPLLFA